MYENQSIQTSVSIYNWNSQRNTIAANNYTLAADKQAVDKAKNITLLNDFLKPIDKDIKKVAILGNWEYWGKVDLAELNRIYAEGNNLNFNYHFYYHY